jgi:Predicted transcriptional regulators
MGSANTQYKISYDNFEVEITILKIEELCPHEEIDEEVVSKIIKSIKESGMLHHPIIVDKNSLVILDGTHRFISLKRLNCKFVPVVLVNYKDERIKIGKWVRKIYYQDIHAIMDKILSILQNFDYRIKEYNKMEKVELYEKIMENLFISLILDKIIIIYLENISTDLNNFLIKSFDEIFTNEKIKIEFITEHDAIEEMKKMEKNLILFGGKRFTKEEVIGVKNHKKLYPIKSTRHIFPLKVFNLNILIEILRLPDKEAIEKFYSIMKNKQPKVLLPPFSIENIIVKDYAGVIFE